MTLFVVLAALMLGVALAFPLWPLLRSRDLMVTANAVDAKRLKALDDARSAGVIDDEEYAAKLATLSTPPASNPNPRSRRPAFLASLLVALLVPLGAIMLYQTKGEPAALDPTRMVAPAAPSAEDHGIDMDQAISGLVAKLKESPDNAEGWALLGRAYQSMGKFGESRDALKKAWQLMPDNHDLTVEYAQALALSTEGRRIAGEPRQLIEDVLKADPDHQRALWLIGISDYQAGDYNAAITAWNRLLPALPADSDIAESVRAQIADAQQLGGSVAAVAATPSTLATAKPVQQVSGAGPKLTVRVSLAPSLLARLDPSATLFVYARAESGPPMPLAIKRGPASGLPLTVVLDDAMGMLPNMKLSMFPKVVIGARISKSGDAGAQSGDLQVLSAAIDVNRKEPVDLVIDSVVP
ncbi:MAG: c-type cytochrome biogenesis protein CcmI [Xanthomonadales bacterium]|nr:c-type cytochrome biogenesis protein CcmI [Xanthomonadales bacterium]